MIGAPEAEFQDRTVRNSNAHQDDQAVTQPRQSPYLPVTLSPDRVESARVPHGKFVTTGLPAALNSPCRQLDSVPGHEENVTENPYFVPRGQARMRFLTPSPRHKPVHSWRHLVA